MAAQVSNRCWVGVAVVNGIVLGVTDPSSDQLLLAAVIIIIIIIIAITITISMIGIIIFNID